MIARTLKTRKSQTKECISISQEYRDQRRWVLVACLIIAGTTFANLGMEVQGALGISQITVSIICKAIICLGLVACLPTFLRSKNFIHVLYLSIIVCIVSIIQIVFFSRVNQYFINTLMDFMTLCFPMCVCILMVDDYEFMIEWLYRTACIIAIIVIVTAVLFGGSFAARYSLGFSQSLVIPTNAIILYITRYERSQFKRFVGMVLVVSMVLVILLFGSRGALAAIAAFSSILYLRPKSKDLRSLIAKTSLVLLVFIALIFLDDILIVLSGVVERLGLQSRTFSLLLNGELVSHDSGRIQLYGAIWQDCIQEPFAIRGIDSDYLILGRYCHNFLLAILHNYGFLLGGIIVCFIVYAAIKTVTSVECAETNIMLLFLFLFIPISLWSGNIWSDTGFWPWIVAFIAKNVRDRGVEARSFEKHKSAE